MDKRATIKTLQAAHEAAFSALLRCSCRGRLTQKGCQHAQESTRTQAALDAALQG
jgi:hypothetical protein